MNYYLKKGNLWPNLDKLCERASPCYFFFLLSSLDQALKRRMMNTYFLLHFEHNNDITIITKL